MVGLGSGHRSILIGEDALFGAVRSFGLFCGSFLVRSGWIALTASVTPLAKSTHLANPQPRNFVLVQKLVHLCRLDVRNIPASEFLASTLDLLLAQALAKSEIKSAQQTGCNTSNL